jgi:hypothetical protein
MTNVVLYEEGRNWYGTHATIASIRKYSPKTNIFLLTDSNESYDCLTFHIDDYSLFWKLFRSHYKHRHPEHPSWFLERCLKRWVVSFEFVWWERMFNIWFFDTDVLVFTDLEKEDYSLYGHYGTSRPETHIQAPSWIRSYSELNDFYTWLVKFYRTKEYINHLELTDMLLFDLFFKAQYGGREESGIDISLIGFDHNLCLGYRGFKCDEQSKIINFKNGFPYGEINGKDILFKSLHCWGVHKPLMLNKLRQAEESFI